MEKAAEVEAPCRKCQWPGIRPGPCISCELKLLRGVAEEMAPIIRAYVRHGAGERPELLVRAAELLDRWDADARKAAANG